MYVMNILTNKIWAGCIGSLEPLLVTNSLQVVTIIEFKIVTIAREKSQYLVRYTCHKMIVRIV